MGLWMGFGLALLGLLDDTTRLSWTRILVSLLLGGSVAGALYGLGVVLVTNRIRAGVVMAVAASVGLMIVFFGWRFDIYWGMGPLCGIGGGLTYGVLMWQPPERHN